MADRAMEASILPPPPPPPRFASSFPPPTPQRQREDAPNTSNGQADHAPAVPPPSHLPPHAPPLALRKPSQTQTVPDVNRPDSAYGGSRGTPSLLSTVCKAACTTCTAYLY